MNNYRIYLSFELIKLFCFKDKKLINIYLWTKNIILSNPNIIYFLFEF